MFTATLSLGDREYKKEVWTWSCDIEVGGAKHVEYIWWNVIIYQHLLTSQLHGTGLNTCDTSTHWGNSCLIMATWVWSGDDQLWLPHCLTIHWCSTSIPDHHSIGEEGWELGIRGGPQTSRVAVSLYHPSWEMEDLIYEIECHLA